MKTSRFDVIGLFVVLLLNQSLVAQTLSFNRIKVPEASPISGWISGITQDNQGYLWISSSYALHRCDGYNVTTYAHDASNPNSLAPGNIEAVYADREGFIWIGSQFSGLDRLDPRTGIFTHFTHDRKNPTSIGQNFVSCIIEDQKGTLWIGTHNGLDELDRKTGKFKHHRNVPGDPTSLSNDQVRTLYEDRQGNIWVGTGSPFFEETPKGSGGLNRMDRANGKFVRYLHNRDDSTSLADNRIRALFEDSHGTFWVGTFGDGLHTMDREKGTFQRHQYAPGDPGKLSRPYLQNGDRNAALFGTSGSGISFITEVQGDIWIGATIGGLNRYNLSTKKMTHYEPGSIHANGLQDHSFWSALKTRDGTLILGTCSSGEIYSVRASPFHLTHYLTPNAVSTFYKDRSNNIWLGSGLGLKLKDYKTGKIESIGPLIGLKPNDWVYTLFSDRQGTVWIGTQAGLIAYDIRTKRTKHYRRRHDNIKSISSDSVSSIHEDRRGNLWVGTAKGLDLMDRKNESFTHYTRDQSGSGILDQSWVVDVLEDKSGSIWFVTRWSWNTGTLNKLDRKTGTVQRYPKFTDLIAIAEDSTFLWIASRNNLYRMTFDTEVITRFTDPQTGDGISSIQNIMLDKHSNLWVNTVGGLLHIPPSRDRIRRFVTSAGNNASGAYQGKRNFYESESGEVFFGNRNGYYSFFPAHLASPDTNAPQVVFHNFRLTVHSDDLTVNTSLQDVSNPSNSIELNYEQDAFSIGFAGIHYGNPELNKHLFKLEGYDKSWHQPASERTAYYYNLPPGGYNFRVRAANEDGVWAERALTILIHPPWWRTWWAYTLYVTTFSVLIFGFIKYRLRVHQEKLLMERKNWEAQQLKEVDEMKTRFFSNMTHEFRTPLSLILPATEQLLKELTKSDHLRLLSIIKRQARQLLHLINQLLDLSKLEDGSMQSTEQRGDILAFTNQLVDSFRPAVEEKGIQLEIGNLLSVPACYFDADKWGKIINNLLSNALKFTPAGGKIKVAFELIDAGTGSIPSVIFTVEDNGPGIEPDKLPHIFDRFYQADNSRTRAFEGTGIGLALVKEMVELVNGSVHVESVLGKYTKFIVTLPVAYASANSVGLVPPAFYPPENQYSAETRNQPQSNDESLPLVIVVEDHTDLRNFIADSLVKSYRVLTAASGQQGLELTREHLPDVVISDVMMSGMDGFELTELIKKHPDTNHIAVVLLTAKAAQESKLEGLSLGADDYITKPFQFDELVLRIRNIIDRQRKLHQRYQHQLKADTVPLVETVHDKFWQSICNAIEVQLDNPAFDVDALAASVNTSRRTLYRKLSTLTGLKPNDVIRDYRLKRAKHFLTAGYSISDTAYRVGFESPSYFGKCFRETYKTTPSEYVQDHMAQLRE